jgi:hypothetical protein
MRPTVWRVSLTKPFYTSTELDWVGVDPAEAIVTRGGGRLAFGLDVPETRLTTTR